MICMKKSLEVRGWFGGELVVFFNVDGNSKASLISISIVNMSLQTFMSRAATSIVSVDGRSVQRNLHPRGTNSSAFHTSLLFFIEARGEFLCYSPLLKLLFNGALIQYAEAEEEERYVALLFLT